jgi:uncharacterized protein YcaQ
MESISIQTARRLQLAAQALDRLPPRPAAKADVLQTIRSMHVLQIDTIHVIRRSPYLVLWSRLGDFQPEWLEQLLVEGQIFEYWSHALCFIPMEDYPLYRRSMLNAIKANGWPVKWSVKFIKENPQLIRRIRTHLRKNGPVRSADFEGTQRPIGGWWNWKAEKDALEALFFTGELMIARRHNFQRVYDLRERVLKGPQEARIPSTRELYRTLVLRAVSALGIATPAWASDYFRQPRKGLPQFLEALASQGELVKVQLEDLQQTAYIHPDRMRLLEEVENGRREPALTTLLSPFDPLVWDRRRARELFNFDYTIEVYTPAPKRRYGYFTLPILQGDRLIGRLDPKAHRTEGLLEIKSIHLEPGVRLSQEMVDDLAGVLRRFAAWHETPDVVVRQSDPPSLTKRLSKALG